MPRGSAAEEHAAQDGCRQAEEEHRQVQVKVGFGRQRERRNHGNDHFQQAPGETYAQDSTNQRKRHAFGQKLREQLPARCAQCGADCNFSLPRGAPGEEQIGNVHARNQENETDRAHQQPQIFDRVFADEIILQRFDGGAPPLIGLWIDFGDVPRDGVHVRVGLLDGDARLKTAHH